MNKIDKKTVKLIVIGIILVVSGITICANINNINRIRKQWEIRRKIDKARETGDSVSVDIVSFEHAYTYENRKFQDFLIGEIDEMMDNGEYRMIKSLLYYVEGDEAYMPDVKKSLTDKFVSLSNLEDASACIEQLSYLEYYNSDLEININSPIVRNYVEKNGREEVIKSGAGYYANEEDYSSFERIGIEGSALHEGRSYKYLGDFKIKHEYGTKLNSFYEESDYSCYDIFYKDIRIRNYSLTEDDIIYGDTFVSGDYIYFFDVEGKYITCEKIR